MIVTRHDRQNWEQKRYKIFMPKIHQQAVMKSSCFFVLHECVSVCVCASVSVKEHETE